MALSASESSLLTETCANMNIAANTCREVLEMLRSLGNTGVVDIATHSNAATAHANATNLVHYDSVHGIHAGQAGAVNAWPSLYPLEITVEGDYINTQAITETAGTTGKVVRFRSFKAITNSNRELIDIDGASQVIGSDEFVITSFHNTAQGLKDGQLKDVASILNFKIGSLGHTGDFNYTTMTLACANGSTTAYCYDFNSDAIVPYYPSVNPTLGTASYPFNSAYFVTAATVVSDRREKANVSALDAKALAFVKGLRPVQYTVKHGKSLATEADEDGKALNVEITPGTRRHWGLIAQEVQEALVSAGYNPSDCAVWSLADKNDPDSKQALRYEELIAPMIKVIQNQQERIEALERKVA